MSVPSYIGKKLEEYYKSIGDEEKYLMQKKSNEYVHHVKTNILIKILTKDNYEVQFYENDNNMISAHVYENMNYQFTTTEIFLDDTLISSLENCDQLFKSNLVSVCNNQVYLKM